MYSYTLFGTRKTILQTISSVQRDLYPPEQVGTVILSSICTSLKLLARTTHQEAFGSFTLALPRQIKIFHKLNPNQSIKAIDCYVVLVVISDVQWVRDTLHSYTQCSGRAPSEEGARHAISVINFTDTTVLIADKRRRGFPAMNSINPDKPFTE